jgi:hypothetical protein
MNITMCSKFFCKLANSSEKWKELLRPAAHTLDIKALLPERTN